MKAPLQIIFVQPHAGEVKTMTKCPPDFNYLLRYAKVIYTACDLGEFIIQSVEGRDYWLEVWWFNIRTKGVIEIGVDAPVVAVAVFLQGNIEGDLSGHGRVHTEEKTINVFYIPAGTQHVYLRKEEYLLFYFVPPDNSFGGMTIEHNAVEELINRQLQQSKKGNLLRGFPILRDVWLKLKRMETISEQLFALDLPIRKFMLELLNHYNEELRKYEKYPASYSSSKEKASVLREYLLAHLHDPAIGGLDELAKRFYVSVKSMTKEFKALTGMTVHQYIVDQRLEYAKALLENVQTPLIDIVTASGFADTSHFIKKFKKKYGYTPRRKK
jgi:AraC-like DNA-binding protein